MPIHCHAITVPPSRRADPLLDHLTVRGENLPWLDGKTELTEVAPHLPWHVVHILGHGTISVPLQRPVTRCIQRDRGNPFLLGCKNTEADIVRGRLEREHRRCEYRSARSSRVRYLHLQRPRIVASTTSLDAFCIDLTGLAISRNVSKCSELAIKCSKLPRQMFGARLRTDPGSSEHPPSIEWRPGR